MRCDRDETIDAMRAQRDEMDTAYASMAQHAAKVQAEADAFAKAYFAAKARQDELLAALKALIDLYGPSTDYDHVAQIAWADAEAAVDRAENK